METIGNSDSGKKESLGSPRHDVGVHWDVAESRLERVEVVRPVAPVRKDVETWASDCIEEARESDSACISSKRQDEGIIKALSVDLIRLKMKVDHGTALASCWRRGASKLPNLLLPTSSSLTHLTGGK